LAAGQRVPFDNGRYIGEAGAGGAAIAFDASTATYNPAGLTRITHPQSVLGETTLLAHTVFHGTTRNDIPDLNNVRFDRSGRADSKRIATVPAMPYIPLGNDSC